MPAGARSEAKKKGESTYFTGVPCKHGHLAPRRTHNGGCTQCIKSDKAMMGHRLRSRAWNARNPERKRKVSLEWFHRNKEVQNAKRRERNKDPLVAERKRQYRAKNSERQRDYYAKWRLLNKEVIRSHQRNNKAKRRAAEGSHTAADIRRIYAEQEGRCAYCSVEVGEYFHVDHIIPLARGGSNWPDNLCIACETCNTRKRAMTGDEFRKVISRVAA